MSTTVFDSALFRDMFGTAEMRDVFSDKALIQRYIEVEVALARAEARCGVIPAEAAEQIAEQATFDALDLALMQHETEIVGYPILPLGSNCRRPAATPDVMCTGARPPRTSWTRRWSCKSVPR